MKHRSATHKVALVTVLHVKMRGLAQKSKERPTAAAVVPATAMKIAKQISTNALLSRVATKALALTPSMNTSAFALKATLAKTATRTSTNVLLDRVLMAAAASMRLRSTPATVKMAGLVTTAIPTSTNVAVIHAKTKALAGTK